MKKTEDSGPNTAGVNDTDPDAFAITKEVMRNWVTVYLYLTTGNPVVRRDIGASAADAALAYEAVGDVLEKYFDNDGGI